MIEKFEILLLFPKVIIYPNFNLISSNEITVDANHKFFALAKNRWKEIAANRDNHAESSLLKAIPSSNSYKYREQLLLSKIFYYKLTVSMQVFIWGSILLITPCMFQVYMPSTNVQKSKICTWYRNVSGTKMSQVAKSPWYRNVPSTEISRYRNVPGTEMSRYRNVSRPKCPGTEMSLGPKCPGTEMSMVPKCPSTEMSLGPKCPGAEMYLVPKCPCTEMSLGPKCPYRNVSCRKVWDRNLKQPKYHQEQYLFRTTKAYFK